MYDDGSRVRMVDIGEEGQWKKEERVKIMSVSMNAEGGEI